MSALPKQETPVLSFRRARENDIEAIAAIEKRAYEFPWTAGNFRDAMLSGYRFWCCWQATPEGDQLVGYAIIMLAVDEAHLLNLAVDPRFQGHGIGRRLLGFAIEDAARKECRMLFLEVRPSNAVARTLYATAGFTQHGIRKGYYPARNGREDALFLGVELPWIERPRP